MKDSWVIHGISNSSYIGYNLIDSDGNTRGIIYSDNGGSNDSYYVSGNSVYQIGSSNPRFDFFSIATMKVETNQITPNKTGTHVASESEIANIIKAINNYASGESGYYTFKNSGVPANFGSDNYYSASNGSTVNTSDAIRYYNFYRTMWYSGYISSSTTMIKIILVG